LHCKVCIIGVREAQSVRGPQGWLWRRRVNSQGAYARYFRVGGLNAWVTTVPSGLSSVIQVTAGQVHTCALVQNGTISCWGATWLQVCNCIRCLGQWVAGSWEVD